MRAWEISRVSVGMAPHFIRDAIAALITLLPVPGVPGQLTTGLLFMKLQDKNTDIVGDVTCGTPDGEETVSHMCTYTLTSCMYSAWMLISVEAYSERTKLVSWPSHALLPELTVRASVLTRGKTAKKHGHTKS